ATPAVAVLVIRGATLLIGPHVRRGLRIAERPTLRDAARRGVGTEREIEEALVAVGRLAHFLPRRIGDRLCLGELLVVRVDAAPHPHGHGYYPREPELDGNRVG